MKLLMLLVSALLRVDSWNPATLEETTFENWKRHFGKSYNTDGILEKLKWRLNLDLLIKHNSHASRGNSSFEIELNQFADKNSQDWKSALPNVYHSNSDFGSAFIYFLQGVDLPDAINWRDLGYVTPVKDQGDCAASWAFSATGALEGQHYRKTGELVSLSEQQLIDCSNSRSCMGGWFQRAFLYLRGNHGIENGVTYRYQAQAGQSCLSDSRQVVATCTGYVHLPGGDENTLKKALATIGPVAAYIDASHRTFQLYRRGVYDEPKCDTILLNHAVLIVGYGTENGKDYWLVKNSFGVQWGENGYIKMSRNKNNQCGIATLAAYPLV